VALPLVVRLGRVPLVEDELPLAQLKLVDLSAPAAAEQALERRRQERLFVAASGAEQRLVPVLPKARV